MKELPPTSDYLHECFEYDRLTGGLIWKERPPHHFSADRTRKIINTKISGRAAASSLNGRYLVAAINKKFYLCHRIVWCMHNGSWPDGDIDHINGNKLDNRIENLREVNRSQNMSNIAKPQKNNKSGYIGVFWATREGKWKPVVAHNGKNIYLGLYDTPEDAAIAYNAAATKYHGEYADKKVRHNENRLREVMG